MLNAIMYYELVDIFKKIFVILLDLAFSFLGKIIKKILNFWYSFNFRLKFFNSIMPSLSVRVHY